MKEAKLQLLWTAGIAFLLATMLVFLAPSNSKMSRFAKLELAYDGFRDTYLMSSKSNPRKGYIVNRRDSTMRRSDNRQPGRMWDVFRFRGSSADSQLDTWLVKSKRKGKGTVFFVPVGDLDDWSYPFLYRFVSKRRKELKLPEVEWTNFYINRVYQGLYLRIALPFDLRKKDKGSGILRELLTIEGNQMTFVDTRFDDAPGIYADSVEAGLFPALTSTDPSLIWLSSRSPTEGVTMLMSNQMPSQVSLLPLPISLPGLFEAKNGRRPAGFQDERFRNWTAWKFDSTNLPQFSDAELSLLKSDFEQFNTSFTRALRMDGEFHRNSPFYEAELPNRQAAIADLNLTIGNF